jgi:hypothetical protein
LSDQEVVSALEAMEQLLHDDSVEPEAIAAWQKRFDAALVSAERGPGWDTIVARANKLAARLDAVTLILSEQRDQMRKELDHQAQGARALKGYKPA